MEREIKLSQETIKLIEDKSQKYRFYKNIAQFTKELLTDPAILSSLKGGEIKDNKISEVQVVKLVKSFAECTYQSNSKYPTQWAFTDEQIISVIQNIISICHIHNQ